LRLQLRAYAAIIHGKDHILATSPIFTEALHVNELNELIRVCSCYFRNPAAAARFHIF
jgi:hypothetical protein